MPYTPTPSMFISLYPFSEIIRKKLASIIAESSQRFINQNKVCDIQFTWQDAASAFSVLKSDVYRVCKYILNQPEHHRKISYSEEYEEFIKFYRKTLQPSKKH